MLDLTYDFLKICMEIQMIIIEHIVPNLEIDEFERLNIFFIKTPH